MQHAGGFDAISGAAALGVQPDTYKSYLSRAADKLRVRGDRRIGFELALRRIYIAHPTRGTS